MKKILFTITILILFFSCKTQNKKNISQPRLPENTTVLRITPNSFVKELPPKLNENSGMIFYRNLFWTFNDSGGKNTLYAFNKKGQIKREIEIKNAKNVDWEDIAQDKNHIYIGDFGNNNGVRNNLKIYKINKKDITKKKNGKVHSSEIEFEYANQETFHYSPLSAKFDCEAMIEFKDHLYLFTKDWSDRTTTVYKMPKKKGKYRVQPIDSFEVNGLVTGADISPDEKKIALIGYRNYNPYAWLFSNFPDDNFFKGENTYVQLEGIYDAQTEGICFIGNDSLAISCESTHAFAHQVFLIGLQEIK